MPPRPFRRPPPALPLLVLLGSLGLVLGTARLPAAAPSHADLDHPAHGYRQRLPRDRFTLLKDDFESGRIPLDRSDEKAFLLALLKALDIPASSQLLVFSTTSLQSSLISTSNPRALYFRDDTYVGYIPRGRIEVISLDPELGAVFYIFDIPSKDQPLRVERSNRCMNCHAGPDTHDVPGLLAESVIPGPNRGSLVSHRSDESGHGVPFDRRFGGWFLTGRHALTGHWANLTGRLSRGELLTFPVDPATAFDASKYPVATSDVVAHLVHEHQIGFVNRLVEAHYRIRACLHGTDPARGLDPETSREIDEQVRSLVRYLLFADEAPLPADTVKADPAFAEDFRRDRRPARDGSSLKDFDLGTRLFRHRCSYLIYSPLVASLPAESKRRLYLALARALRTDNPVDGEFAYLPATERAAIRTILRDTLPDLPTDW